jgi:hypothetical protein
METTTDQASEIRPDPDVLTPAIEVEERSLSPADGAAR